MPDDETVVDTSTTEETGEQAGVTEEASAETENTETEAEQRIPYDRFKEVVGEKNEWKLRSEALEEQVRELQEVVLKKATSEPEGPRAADPLAADKPPEGLSEQEQIRWHVLKNAASKEGAIQILKAAGLDPELIQQTLGTVKELAASWGQQTWSGLFKEHGLDMANDEHKKVVSAFNESGKFSPQESAAAAARYFQVGPAAPKPKAPEAPKSVVTEGVGSVMTQGQALPKDAAEAVRMAAKGERAPHKSTLDILTRPRKEGNP